MRVSGRSPKPEAQIPRPQQTEGGAGYKADGHLSGLGFGVGQTTWMDAVGHGATGTLAPNRLVEYLPLAVAECPVPFTLMLHVASLGVA